jgi:CelD/BcsL family acetyltransferase involved in cellulose biosynthesis
LNVETHHSVAVFDRYAAELDALLAISTNSQVFLTRQWLSIWWEVYHPGDLEVLLVFDDHHTLVGMAPLYASNGPQRTIHFIGCEDVTDYLDVLVAPGHEAEVYVALAKAIGSLAGAGIDLCNIPRGSITLDLWPALLAERGVAVTVLPQAVCPVICLPGSWDDYLAALDKKQRHELRRKIRRAEEVNGELSFDVIDADEELSEDAIRDFLVLMARSDVQKSAFLDDPKNVVFFNRILPAMHRLGYLEIVLLKIDGVAVASYLNLLFRGRVLVYNSGFDAQEFGHLSPGIVLLAFSIQRAIGMERTVYDFLRGDEVYKYRMGAQDTHVMNLRTANAQ